MFGSIGSPIVMRYRRMNGIRFLGVFCYCFSIVPGMGAPEAFPGIDALIREKPVIRCSYSQTRYLTDFNRELQSGGEVVIARDVGVLWKQREPFSMTIVVEQDQLWQVFPNRAPQRMDAGGSSPLGQLNTLFLALLTVDVEALLSHFTVEVESWDPCAWAMELHPRSEPMQGLLESIQVRGGAFVEYICIQDAEGNRTEIRFHSVEDEPEALRAEERKLFGR